MKINDKSLSKFASSGAPPDKEGHLHKRGDFNKGFQKRWFVLKGNLLFYYEKRTDKDPIGVIILEDCTIELSDHEDGFTFMIHFIPGSGTRTYILSADTQEEMEEWMKVLSCASYDYMKLCVNELKNQLSNLDSKSNKTLLQNVFEESDQIKRSTQYFENSRHGAVGMATSMSSSSSSGSVSSKRYNPFNSDDFLPMDNEEVRRSQNSMIEKTARTFEEMHKEFGQQIKEIMAEWKKNKHKHLFVDFE